MQIIKLMKKLLPTSTTLSLNKGFTLIELLVVIAIISVLAVIGFAAFGGLTTKGNDSRRQADIKSIADALEVKKANNSYQTIAATDFATGKFPKEPTTRSEKYCYSDGTAVITNPAVWAATDACPANWQNIDGAAPTVTSGATFFKVCTVNEAKTDVICYGSRQ